jgi:hypothetical protein
VGTDTRFTYHFFAVFANRAITQTLDAIFAVGFAAFGARLDVAKPNDIFTNAAGSCRVFGSVVHGLILLIFFTKRDY